MCAALVKEQLNSYFYLALTFEFCRIVGEKMVFPESLQ